MSDVWSEGDNDAGIPESRTLAPACGTPTIWSEAEGRVITMPDFCLCGCDAYYERCSRWNTGDPTHTCC